MKIKAKVVMLPTKNQKASKLLYDDHRIVNPLTKGVAHAYTNNGFKYQHLFFTTDEKIKVGDWCLYKDKYIVQVKETDPSGYICSDSCKPLFHEVQKIVASTDETLTNCPNKYIEYGCCDKPEFCQVPQNIIPRPSNEFLKAYCEQEGIDEVLIEYTNHEQETGELAHTDEELIPYIKIDPDNTITIHPIKQK